MVVPPVTESGRSADLAGCRTGQRWSRPPRTLPRSGWPSHAARLAATIFRYLDVGGHYAEAITMHSHARRAASGSATAPPKPRRSPTWACFEP